MNKKVTEDRHSTSLAISNECNIKQQHLVVSDGDGDGIHSSALAWRIPGMEGPGGLTSMGSHRVRHD